MKILKYLLLLVLIVVIGGAIYLATLDGHYKVERTKTIKAPIELVYQKVNDFTTWESWSPWLYKDPNTKLNFGEITKGVGASYSWESDHKDVGTGSMETLEAQDNAALNQKITFTKPWEQESNIYWVFKSVEGGTEVTWGMQGEMPFMARYMAAKMDDFVGPDYENGLQKLDSVIEKDMQQFSIDIHGETTHGGGYYLYNTTACKIDELANKMAQMMPEVGAYVEANNITMAGPAFALYHKYDEANNAVIFSCAVPVTDRVITDKASGIQTGLLRPFKAIKTTLKGDYKNLYEAWTKTDSYITANGLAKNESIPSLEIYANDPMEYPNPADWITEIYIPIN